MIMKPYGVHVIVDPHFGSRLWEIPDGEPVWIAATGINRPSYQAVGKERNPESYLVGLSSFKIDPNASPEDWLITEIETIDLHHGGMSHDPSYSFMNIIGISWSEKIQNELNRFGFIKHEGKYSACFQIFKNSSGHEPKNLLQEEA